MIVFLIYKRITKGRKSNISITRKWNVDIEFYQRVVMRVYSSGEEACGTLGRRPQSQKTDYVYPQFLSGPILAS